MKLSKTANINTNNNNFKVQNSFMKTKVKNINNSYMTYKNQNNRAK